MVESNSISFSIYLGREQENPQSPNEKMCPRFEEASLVSSMGESVEKVLCKKGEHECPFFNTCEYISKSRRLANHTSFAFYSPAKMYSESYFFVRG